MQIRDTLPSLPDLEAGLRRAATVSSEEVVALIATAGEHLEASGWRELDDGRWTDGEVITSLPIALHSLLCRLRGAT